MDVVIDLLFVVFLAYHHSVRGCESRQKGLCQNICVMQEAIICRTNAKRLYKV